QLIYKAYGLLARRGHLLTVIRTVDPAARQLIQEPRLEWVKSRIGVIGLISIEVELSAAALVEVATRAIANAHGALDALPERELTADDVWNLLLIISLPWTLDEAREDQAIFEALFGLERDLRGSRKLLLWRGNSPLEHLGGFTADLKLWVPSSPNPLRDEIE